MTDFRLDTSGFVEHPHGSDDVSAIYWADLSPFEQGYIEALFANPIMVPGPDGPEALLHPAFSDLAPATLETIRKDCAALDLGHSRDPQAQRHNGKITWTHRQKGLYPDFPPLTVTLGDDGKVYARAAQAAASIPEAALRAHRPDGAMLNALDAIPFPGDRR